jgi:hypothetical protein
LYVSFVTIVLMFFANRDVEFNKSCCIDITLLVRRV